MESLLDTEAVDLGESRGDGADEGDGEEASELTEGGVNAKNPPRRESGAAEHPRSRYLH